MKIARDSWSRELLLRVEAFLNGIYHVALWNNFLDQYVLLAVAEDKGILVPLIFASLRFREILHINKLLGVVHPKSVRDFNHIIN